MTPREQILEDIERLIEKKSEFRRVMPECLAWVNNFIDEQLKELDGNMDLDTSYMNDKKKNVAYWDEIDRVTEDYLIKMMGLGGMHIDSVNMELIKETVDEVTTKLEKIKGIQFPYVNEDY